MRINERAANIKASSTLALTAKAKELRAAGADILSFTAGEPDFDTPKHIRDAAKSALDEGFTKYTPSSGTAELREAICAKLKKDNGLSYEPAQIVVSNGAKHSLFNAFYTILDDGDEVVTPAPYWVSYAEIITMCGGAPVPVYTNEADGFKADAGLIERAITAKTKAIIINSPSNPAGVVYNRGELAEIAEIAKKYDLAIISDEVYEKLIFDDGLEHVSAASLNDDALNRSIIINGVSKSYSMTGWRIGYAAAPRDVAAAMGNLQSHATSNPNSIAQKAAFAALVGDGAPVEDMRLAFKSRRDVIMKAIDETPGISAVCPQGAFYVFVNVEKLVGGDIDGMKINDAADVAAALLSRENVVVVPGADFGYANYIRLSFAISEEEIGKGMDRIKNFISECYSF